MEYACNADAVIITATEAFVLGQQALAALAFFDQLNTTNAQLAFPDSAGCMTGDFATMNLKDLYFRHLKCGSSISTFQLRLYFFI
jgi:hypothetical protein